MCGVRKIYVRQYNDKLFFASLTPPEVTSQYGESSYLHRNGEFHSLTKKPGYTGDKFVAGVTHPGYWHKKHAALAAARKTGYEVVDET